MIAYKALNKGLHHNVNVPTFNEINMICCLPSLNFQCQDRLGQSVRPSGLRVSERNAFINRSIAPKVMNFFLFATVTAGTMGSNLSSATKFTCPTTFSDRVCSATQYDLHFGTTCCKTVGYVFTNNGCVVRGTDQNPLKCWLLLTSANEWINKFLKSFNISIRIYLKDGELYPHMLELVNIISYQHNINNVYKLLC